MQITKKKEKKRKVPSFKTGLMMEEYGMETFSPEQHVLH